MTVAARDPDSGAGDGAPRAQVMVVVAEAAGDAGEWGALVGELARALGLEPDVAVLPRSVGRRAAVAAELATASTVPGPVLLLPWRGRRRGRGRAVLGTELRRGRVPALRRVLIPSDASDDVAGGARLLRDRLAKAGFRSTILHVLTEDNRPRMWEGSGHHAAQWFDEMRRRHGASPETLTVVPGDPEHELETYASGADLVVVLWRHDVSFGHAALLRSVLQRGIAVPHLLVPLVWLDGPDLSPPDATGSDG
jgi:hypothetical protein